jgi:hypothetical protein
MHGAATMSWLLGLGFGIPAVVGLRHFATTGEIWTLWGYPTYGNGPFERIGLPTSTPLLAAFAAVCLAEVVSGVLLWVDAPGAVAVSWVLLPVEVAFWIGFALPFGPLVAVVRTVLILLA